MLIFLFSGRAGRDGKPSKCILYHSSEDYSILYSFINDTKQKHITEATKTQQRQLLERVKSFTLSTQCRRIELLNYLGTNDDELRKITIRENCCDNCKLDLMFKVPLHLLYDDVDEKGQYDFTDDARLVLEAVNPNLLRRNIAQVILGEMPSKDNYRWFNMSVFGKGRKKTAEWWNGVISMLVMKLYIRLIGNTLRLETKARNFIRFKGETFQCKPSLETRTGLKKRVDIELFWEKGKVGSRPKTEVEMFAIDVVNPISRDPVPGCSSAQRNADTQSFSFDDDDDWDSALLEAAQTAEAAEKLKHEQTSDPERDARDQLEIEIIGRVIYEDDSSNSSDKNPLKRKQVEISYKRPKKRMPDL